MACRPPEAVITATVACLRDTASTIEGGLERISVLFAAERTWAERNDRFAGGQRHSAIADERYLLPEGARAP
jgi:hypothetical protein